MARRRAAVGAASTSAAFIIVNDLTMLKRLRVETWCIVWNDCQRLQLLDQKNATNRFMYHASPSEATRTNKHRNPYSRPQPSDDWPYNDRKDGTPSQAFVVNVWSMVHAPGNSANPDDPSFYLWLIRVVVPWIWMVHVSAMSWHFSFDKFPSFNPQSIAILTCSTMRSVVDLVLRPEITLMRCARPLLCWSAVVTVYSQIPMNVLIQHCFHWDIHWLIIPKIIGPSLIRVSILNLHKRTIRKW